MNTCVFETVSDFHAKICLFFSFTCPAPPPVSLIHAASKGECSFDSYQSPTRKRGMRVRFDYVDRYVHDSMDKRKCKTRHRVAHHLLRNHISIKGSKAYYRRTNVKDSDIIIENGRHETFGIYKNERFKLPYLLITYSSTTVNIRFKRKWKLIHI
ncbi:hypothetical protein CEXT_578591 [Caerostris extrusa]|uniref:Uncharacterized protein n=1 Tax=Caerostris extrusa TaxID=172846 RepID=A0AAV4S9J0_CAEEX|nr:hypothetical protein CEXT_578591 [Caerostris extrusa]